jgi:nucleotide-binding universal stress UspA family protein
MISIKSILYPTDFSKYSLYALDYALSFAKQYGAKLSILHVLPNFPLILGQEATFVNIPKLEAATSEQVEKELGKLQEQCAAQGVESETTVMIGTPFVQIINAAREKDVDLIVIATHGRTGISHVLFGSVAERVVRMAPCPVLSIKHPEHEFVMP